MNRINPCRLAVAAFLLPLFLNACGGGARDDGNASATGDPVLDSLVNLGVPVENTARRGDDNQPLPDDYSPFGSARSFDTIEEILLIGPQFANIDSRITLFELQSQNNRPIYAREDYFAPASTDTPWADASGIQPENLRAASAADIDGDGLDEVVVVYREGDGSVMLQTWQESVTSGVIGFAVDQTLVVSSDPAIDLALQAGDFNGDGLAEFAVGLALDGGARLLFLANSNGNLELAPSMIDLPQAVAGSRISLSLASGNLDNDAGQELVAVVNERFAAGNREAGTARYFLYDDGGANHAALGNDLIRATLSQVNRTAIVADVAIGDIDGDNVDEILFGGLQNFDPNGNCGYRYLLVALDDIPRSNLPLGGRDLVPSLPGGCSRSDPGQLRFVHVNVVDLDGDGLAEIQANQYLFEDFVQAEPWSQYVWGLDENGQPRYAVIDEGSLFDAGTGGFRGRFDRDNSSMTAGDFTADGRQNILFYSQATNRLETWGLSNPDAGSSPLTEPIFDREWRRMNQLPLQDPGAAAIRPILIASNINHDSLALRFSEGEYRLIFTEPVLIAALAAAPCDPSRGQSEDACRTSYGTASSTTVSEEKVLSVRASATAGFEVEFSALGVKVTGFQMLATLQARASRIQSRAYRVTKRIVYTTGPIEDTVIFTTIPLDQYTYEVTSHPDPELIGSRVVISLPREPIEIQVERSRYNENRAPGGPVVDSSLFRHRIGKPSSYPSAADKDDLLARYTGFEHGPTSVGNSGGFKSLSINVAEETGTGTAYGADFDLSLQGTAGTVVAGFSVGTSYDDSLQIIHGEESEYTGSVAEMDLPTNEYGKQRFSWGLFTYLYDDSPSGQQFEIINYWVE